jgi:hypothetical protein
MSIPSPVLSVIVVVYRMQREAVRTLYSLTSEYQRRVDPHQYEVVVVENPSDAMLGQEDVESFGPNFRYVRCPERSVTPATAINLGSRAARGEFLTLLIDGARILSPGVLHHSLLTTRLHEEPVVATLAWHLGPKNQADSIKDGYKQEEEDRLLAKSQWRDDGYRLFSIAALSASSAGGWFAPLAESNCVTLSRRMFDAVGGCSEEFVTPGGGFVNLDFYRRVVTMPGGQLFVLLGEGTFHQIHGGVATNRTDDRVLKALSEEYKKLRGQRFRVPQPVSQPVYFGTLPPSASAFVLPAKKPRKRWKSLRLWKRKEKTRPSFPAKRVDVTSKVLCVVGMHRSGTSCLAGTLMECGVEFGEVSRKDRYNKKGNRENNRIRELHDSVLRSNGGSWNNPPETSIWNREQQTARDQIVAEYESQTDTIWGFKDPRTLCVLDGWREVAPDLRFVGTFRHPDCVVQSLLHRNPALFTERSAMELWYLHNDRLLTLAQEVRCKLVAFDADDKTVLRQMNAAVADLELEAPTRGCRFFRPRLRHHEFRPERQYPSHVEQLYEALRRYSDDCFVEHDSRERLQVAA